MPENKSVEKMNTFSKSEKKNKPSRLTSKRSKRRTNFFLLKETKWPKQMHKKSMACRDEEEQERI